MYIHERGNWTDFKWDASKLTAILENVSRKQGLLYDRLASLGKCSKDTAIRDIQDLVAKNILREDFPGAKRPSYSIVYNPEDIAAFFSNINIEKTDGVCYLTALYKGKAMVCERILPLDAERFKKAICL